MIFACVVWAAMFGWCISQQPSDNHSEERQRQWMEDLRVGSRWTDPPKGRAVAEANARWTKYVVADPRLGTPFHAYVVVQDGLVISIWQK